MKERKLYSVSIKCYILNIQEIHMEAIVIYSKTGNTRMIAQRIIEQKKMPILEIVPENDDPNIQNPILKENPKIKAFDHLIIGSPVHGFSMPKVTKTYLEQTDFTGKTVDLYITHFFPFAWMGGKQTLNQMRYVIEMKGGVVNSMTSINWKNKKRERDIDALVMKLSS